MRSPRHLGQVQGLVLPTSKLYHDRWPPLPKKWSFEPIIFAYPNTPFHEKVIWIRCYANAGASTTSSFFNAIVVLNDPSA
jgi:hypothetical protein